MYNQKWRKLIVVFLVMLILSGCGVVAPNKTLLEISQVIGVNVAGGTIISKSDSHGGFHGDGSTVVTIRFANTEFAKQLIQQIEAHENWNELPMTDNITALVYGIHTESSSVGPMIHEGDNQPVIPQVQNGYYFFKDRHPQSTNFKSDAGILDRASYNVTIAIFDMDNQMLYYLELDT